MEQGASKNQAKKLATLSAPVAARAASQASRRPGARGWYSYCSRGRTGVFLSPATVRDVRLRPPPSAISIADSQRSRKTTTKDSSSSDPPLIQALLGRQNNIKFGHQKEEPRPRHDLSRTTRLAYIGVVGGVSMYAYMECLGHDQTC